MRTAKSSTTGPWYKCDGGECIPGSGGVTISRIVTTERMREAIYPVDKLVGGTCSPEQAGDYLEKTWNYQGVLGTIRAFFPECISSLEN